ncbi:MAG: DMT family transporter [Rhodobacterales bacterium]|nr:DMT family transporter [Rhodobacterales bacterium]
MQTVPASRHLFGVLCVTGATVAWSTFGFFTLSVSADTPTVLVWRGIFGVLSLLLVLVLREGVSGLAGFGRLGRMGWAFGACGGLAGLTTIMALRETSVTHVSVIFAMAPFFAAALGWLFLHERPSRPAIIASSVALIGAVTMVGLGGEGTLYGDALAVVSVIAYSGLIVISKANPGIPSLPASVLSVSLTTVVAIPFLAGFSIPYADLPMLAAFGVVNSALAILLFMIGARHLPAIQTALIGALETPLAPFWVWLAFGIAPGLLTMVGAAIVVGAVVWYIVQDTRPAGH